jgi:hypothetical protein
VSEFDHTNEEVRFRLDSDTIGVRFRLENRLDRLWSEFESDLPEINSVLCASRGWLVGKSFNTS